MVRLLMALIACVMSASAAAQAKPPRPGALWYQTGHVTLEVTEESSAAKWEFDRAANGDIRIVKDERRAGVSVQGAVIVVCNDGALLMRDIKPVKAREIRELNEPVLMLQLALRLLDTGIPQGPLKLAKHADIDVREGAKPLRVAKGTEARKDFLAPWRLRGNAMREGGDAVRFAMTLSHVADAGAAAPAEITLTGTWHRDARVPQFANDMPLDGWQVFRMDSIARNIGGNMVIDHVAAQQPRVFKTLGEVRQAVERNWDDRAGARRAQECAL